MLRHVGYVMENDSRPDCPYCVRLMTLVRIIEAMSHGAVQWIARPVPGIFVSIEGKVRQFLIVAYSNADGTGLPNPLVYGLPLAIYRSHPEAGDGDRAVLTRESAVPLAGALYWEVDELVYDMQEDEDRFWGPIEKRLRSSLPAADWKCQDGSAVSPTPGDTHTIDGISYRDSLLAYVKWWSQAKERFQNAISF